MNVARTFRSVSPSKCTILSTPYRQNKTQGTPTALRANREWPVAKKLLSVTPAKVGSSCKFPTPAGARDAKPPSAKFHVSVLASPNGSQELENTVVSPFPSNGHKFENDGIYLSPAVLQDSPVADSPTCQHPAPPGGFFYTPDRESRHLGRGAFGNVKLCRYKNRKFALKTIRCPSDVGEKNFLGVRHAHLVRVLRVSEVLNTVLVCMEFAGHCNLQQLLDSRASMGIRCQISFARQVACALRHCHKLSIAHGDVKPANVIVSPTGHCKLGDFGLSLKLASRPTAGKNHLPGTAAYAAPEVLQGKGYSTASDVYSLGITMWQIYSREIPFAEDQHPHVIIYLVVKLGKRPTFKPPQDEIASEYSKIATCCWQHDPEKRPSAAEVTQTLKKLFRCCET